MRPPSARNPVLISALWMSLFGADVAGGQDSSRSATHAAARPKIESKVMAPAVWLGTSPQARLMARRAARVDARTRLIERIKSLRLTGGTRVRDFAVESDLLGEALRDIVRGAVEISTRLRDDAPIAESTLRLSGGQIARAVTMLYHQYNRGTELTQESLDQRAAALGHESIEATGLGLPPQVYLSELAVANGRTIPTWATRFVEATARTSRSNDAETLNPLAAALSAEAAARRGLAEKIAQLAGRGEQTVAALAATSEAILPGVNSLVAEAYVSHTRREAAFVEVTVRLSGVRVWSMIRAAPKP